jgi:hypothetical protein
MLLWGRSIDEWLVIGTFFVVLFSDDRVDVGELILVLFEFLDSLKVKLNLGVHVFKERLFVPSDGSDEVTLFL